MSDIVDNPPVISRIETGKQMPSMHTRMEITKRLNAVLKRRKAPFQLSVPEVVELCRAHQPSRDVL